MKATDLLKAEHQSILRILDVIQKVCARLASGKDVPPEHIERILEFIRGFADRYHHRKEEDILFPALEKAGIPRDGGPVGCMLSEHEEGRASVQRMSEALERYRQGDRGAGAGFLEAAGSYLGLLRQHIDKEDSILYAMADMHLSGEAQQLLMADFARVQEERFAPGTRERFLHLLDDLEEAYRT